VLAHPYGKACDDCAAGKDFRTGRQHHRGHGAACQHARDEYAMPVDAVIADHLFDHLMN
jgi:hypothetical protein